MTAGKKIWNNFVTGIALLFPIFITILIMRFLVLQVNGILLQPITKFFEPFFLEKTYLIYASRIAVFFIVILIVILVGMATKLFIMKKALHLTEGIFLNLPLVRKIYAASKEITIAILGQGKNMVKGIALIEYPRKGIFTLCFITKNSTYSEITKKAKSEELVTVYVPSVPNPTTGYCMFLPKSEITILNITLEEAMKLIISGGIVEPITKNETLIK